MNLALSTHNSMEVRILLLPPAVILARAFSAMAMREPLAPPALIITVGTGKYAVLSCCRARNRSS